MKNTDGVAVKMGATELLSLAELTAAVKSSTLALPQFQRPSVWSDKERRELVVSLCMNVPIGSFLVWEYEESFNTHEETELRSFEGTSLTKAKVEYLLIDGQQRLQILTNLETSEFGKNNFVQFESHNGHIRPRVLSSALKPTLDPTCEILVSELAGLATGVTSEHDENYEKMAKDFRSNLRETQILSLIHI